jgi:diguanylate cyclase (GGDEF)-like protein
MDHEAQGELAPLIGSPEFTRMVERFQASTGQRLQVFDLEGKPHTAVEVYPRYCRLLQERKACPLYFDREYLRRTSETMAVCCSGVGHFVAPIRDEKEEQIGAVVSPAVKFAANEIEPLAQLAFRLKVFPDELIQAAEAVQSVDGEKLLGAGELVSVGLNLLAEMQARERVRLTLRRLQTQIAESNSQMLCQHLVDAVLYLTRADYGLVMLIDDNGSDLASGFDSPSTQTQVEAKRRLTAGVAEWVRHADRSVTVPDIGKSAWCRYLTDDEVTVGSVLGLPIPLADGKETFGAIVVAWDRPREDLAEPMSTLTAFVGEGLHSIVMGRKLIQAEQLALLDLQSGAYAERYLQDLLEKEVSRAARFGHPLALALFDLEGYELLRGRYGEAGLGRVLRELVGIVRAKTRKVNTLARLRDGRFCLVVPEATREVVVNLAQRLQQALEEHPYAATPSGEIVRLKVDTGVAASEAGKDDRATMLAQAEEGLELARSERRRESFKLPPQP